MLGEPWPCRRLTPFQPSKPPNARAGLRFATRRAREGVRPRAAQDHFRKVCQPNYVNVYRDRGGVMGVVEFDTADDLDRAARARLSPSLPRAPRACRDPR